MSMATLNKFCSVFNLIFVEEWQQRGQQVYCFLDYHGQRLNYTAEQICQRMSNSSLSSAPGR